jgi:hypothetical protein
VSAAMNRLQELLAKRLTRGRDDAELDELTRLLDALRRQPVSGWEPCEVDGRLAYRRTLDCGHVEHVFGEIPRAGGMVDEAGNAQEVPLVAICHTCYRVRGDA